MPAYGKGIVVLPGCGEQIDALLAVASPLVVTAEFPSRIDRGGDGTVTGTVRLTTSASHLVGVTSPAAAVFVAASGAVVVLPLPQDLVARPIDIGLGRVVELPAIGSLRRCADGDWLPAGDYELLAAVVVHLDDGSAVAATARPWPLQVT